MTFKIEVVFGHGPKNMSTDDWFSLLTVCLTPLFAHILVGVPEPVHLSNKKITFKDRIVHYNPTSILWRYFAIADRRLRSKDWNAADMAASNAHFWTKNGWDGSEEMLIKSRAYCKRLAHGTRVHLLSLSAAKTLLITLQGAQALFFVFGLNGLLLLPSTSYPIISLENVYFPFAILGLARLFASLWLSEGWAFSADGIGDEKHGEEIRLQRLSTKQRKFPKILKNRESSVARTSSDTPLFHYSSELEARTSSTRSSLVHVIAPGYFLDVDRFHPPLGVRGLLFRCFYLLFVFGLFALSMISLLPTRGDLDQTTLHFNGTAFITAIFYALFTLCSGFLLAIYCFRKKGTTTVIPCISSPWYLVYTCVIFLGVLAVFIVATIETRKTTCGKYSPFPMEQDGNICQEWTIGQNFTIYSPYALAHRAPNSNVIRLYEWKGHCSGGRINNFTELVYMNGSQSVRLYNPPNMTVFGNVF